MLVYNSNLPTGHGLSRVPLHNFALTLALLTHILASFLVISFPGESSLTSLTESIALIEYYERMPFPLFREFITVLISYLFDRLFD